MRKVFHSGTFISRDDFLQTIDFGNPPDPTVTGNEQVLILYQSSDQTAAASQHPQHSALDPCGTLKLVTVQPDPTPSDTCYAIIGQWENYHVQKFMRLKPEDDHHRLYQEPSDAAYDTDKYPLRHVSRLHSPQGRRMRFLDETETARYNQLLANYLQQLPETLQRLKPVAEAAAQGGDSLVIMVCNAGQWELLLNFVCAAQSRNLDLSRVLVFATDSATAEAARSLPQLSVFEVGDTAFGDRMPVEAANNMGDKAFGGMTLAKTYAAHLVSALGYNFLLQDVDVVWYKHPLEFFETLLARQDGQLFDIYFQDDGSRDGSQHGYSANTGFYFVRHTLRSQYLFSYLVRMGDLMLMINVDQPAINLLLHEQASWRGLRVKVLSRESELGRELPNGWNFHRQAGFMKELMTGKRTPYVFHMNWTLNKKDKVKFFQQIGDWFVRSTEASSSSCQGMECCLKEPVVQCHYRDKPSKIPCKDSPPMYDGGASFW